MLLNYIWTGFFLIALVAALLQLVLQGDVGVFGRMVEALFDSAKNGFEISLGLAGVLTLWQGLLKVGENSGLVIRLSRLAAPFFHVLFPSVPKEHPVNGTMLMNFSANLLGLDNAATPIGLEAMRQLQEINDEKERASDAMIMFLCLNASGLTLIPITIIMYRLQLGSVSPSDVFLPILLATAASTLFAIIAVAIKQKIRLWQRAFVLPLVIFMVLVAFLIYFISGASQETVSLVSTTVSHFILIGTVVLFISSGLLAKRNVYEDFIVGAKDGFKTAVSIIPYLVAILVGIGLFRASGAMEGLMIGLTSAMQFVGIDASWVQALPTMMMKPLSGSGARGLMIDAMQHHGADSFVGRLACMVQGASDTTFYVLALYYGSVAIKRTRYTLQVSLLADLVGMIVATLIAYLFYQPI